MAFRQKTHTHSQSANIAIGKGQLTSGNMYGSEPPTTDAGDYSSIELKKRASMNQVGAKTLEQEQRDEDIGKATLHYGW